MLLTKDINIIDLLHGKKSAFLQKLKQVEETHFNVTDKVFLVPARYQEQFSFRTTKMSNSSIEKCNPQGVYTTRLLEKELECSQEKEFSHFQCKFDYQIIDYDLNQTAIVDNRQHIMLIEQKSDFKKLRHELVAMSSSGTFYQTDEKLDKIVKGSLLTPDFIIENDDVIHIVEIGTTESKDVKSKYDKKISYYLNELQNYSGLKQIFVHGIICGSNEIYSSLDLTENFNELIHYFRIAEKLTQNAIEALGWVNNERLQKMNSIKDMLADWEKELMIDDIPDDSDDVMMITKKHIKLTENRMMMLKSDKKLKEEIYSGVVRRANKEVLSKMKTENPEKILKEFKDMIENPKLSGDIRTDDQVSYKAIVQQAFFSINQSCIDEAEWPLIPFNQFYSTEEDDYMQRLYYRAFEYSFKNESKFVKKDTHDERLRKALDPEIKTPSQLKEKADYHRVNLSGTSESDWKKLGKIGIHGKKFKDDIDSKKVYKESKSHFTLNCNIDDVDDFINNVDIWGQRSFSVDPLDSFFELYQESIKHFPNCNEESEEFIRRVKRTDFGIATDIMSLIMEELNLSMNHVMKSERMELKKLKNYHIYLLIKSTGQTKNLFYSVLARKVDIKTFGTCFKKWKTIGPDYLYCDFVSVNRHHLSYLLSAGEKLCVILGTNIEIFRESFTQHPMTLSMKILRQTNLQMLCYMEGKQQTSANIQQLRYLYMETCKQNPIWPVAPLKIITKLSNNPRNRLLVWFYVRSFELFGSYHGLISPVTFIDSKRSPTTDKYSYGTFEEEEIQRSLSKDKIKGLKSIIKDKDGLNDEFTEFRQALNLFYSCNLKNKENRDKDQNIFQLFDKIIEEERKVYTSDSRYFGHEEPPSDHKFQSHEYSPNSILLGSMLIRSTLDQKVDGDYSKDLERRFHNVIESKTSDFFATFRASGIQPPDEYKVIKTENPKTQGDKKIDLEKVRTTKKAVINMSDLIKNHGFGVNPYKDLSLLFKLAKEGILYVQVDEKDQIGGVREIGILKMIHRLLIHFLETLTRLIDEDLPQEMLTKPNKTQTIDNHYYKLTVLTKDDERNMTANSSDDASRWAQGFLMMMFFDALYPILTKPLITLVAKILNLYVKKEIALPQKLLRKFHKYPDIYMPEIGDFTPINELKRQYLGLSKDNWLVSQKFHAGMKNRSNMVQGIMHFTSSFLHACRTTFVANLIRTRFEKLKMKGVLHKDSLLLITNLISSDDSSSHFSIIFKEFVSEEIKGNTAYFLIWAHAVDESSYPLFGMKFGKEKSVNGNFSKMAEFNSVWRAGNTSIAALVKYTFQSVCVKSASSLIQRQETMNGMISQIRSAGGPGILAAICQRCQMRIHYASFGMNTSPIFEDFKRELLKKPIPSLGFFVLCPEQICGVFGMRFSEWFHVRNSTKAKKALKWMYENNTFELSETGVPTVKIELKLGNSALKRKLLSELNIPEDWNEELSLKVKDLYHPVPNMNQINFKIVHKSITVPVDSFGMETAGKLFYSGVYALDNRCITIRKNKQTIFGSEDIPLKSDIFREVSDDPKELERKYKIIKDQILRDQKDKTSLMRIISDVELKEEMSMEDLNFLFPEYYYFTTIESKLEEYSDYNEYERLNYVIASRYVEISRPRLFGKDNNLMNAARRLWFNYKTFGTVTSAQQIFKLYQTHFSFLKEDYKTMIEDEESPFYMDHLGLYNFVNSQISKENKYLVLGPLNTNLGFESTVENIISSSFKHGFSFFTRHSKLTNDEIELKDSLYTKLNIIEAMPLIEREKSLCILELLNDAPLMMPELSSEKITFFKRVGKNTAGLSVIQKFIKNNVDRDQLKDDPSSILSKKISAKRTSNYNGIQLVSDIKEAKGGILIEWALIQQKGSDNNFYGKGILKGNVDKENFILNIFDDSLTSIIVRSNKSLNKIWTSIVDLLIEMKIKKVARRFENLPITGYITKSNRLRDFQFQTVIPKPYDRQDIAPVLIDQNLLYLSFDHLDLVYEKKGKYIKLSWAENGQRTDGGAAISVKITENSSIKTKVKSDDLKYCSNRKTHAFWIDKFLKNEIIKFDDFFANLASFRINYESQFISTSKALFLTATDVTPLEILSLKLENLKDKKTKEDFESVHVLKQWLNLQLKKFLKDPNTFEIKDKVSPELVDEEDDEIMRDLLNEILDPKKLDEFNDTEIFKITEDEISAPHDMAEFGQLMDSYIETGLDSFGFKHMKSTVSNDSILQESSIMNEVFNSIIKSLSTNDDKIWSKFFNDRETIWEVNNNNVNMNTKLRDLMWLLDKNSKPFTIMKLKEFNSIEAFKRSFRFVNLNLAEMRNKDFERNRIAFTLRQDVTSVKDPILHSSENIVKQNLSNRNVFGGKEEL